MGSYTHRRHHAGSTQSFGLDENKLTFHCARAKSKQSPVRCEDVETTRSLAAFAFSSRSQLLVESSFAFGHP